MIFGLQATDRLFALNFIHILAVLYICVIFIIENIDGRY